MTGKVFSKLIIGVSLGSAGFGVNASACSSFTFDRYKKAIRKIQRGVVNAKGKAPQWT